MNQWILLQLLVDIALFALVAVLVIRSGNFSGDRGDKGVEPGTAGQGVDTAQIESLMDELARLALRAEKVADRIERGLDTLTDQPQADPAEKRDTAVENTGEKNDVYTDALRLIGEGLPDGEISEIVGLPAHEISLIRNIST